MTPEAMLEHAKKRKNLLIINHHQQDKGDTMVEIIAALATGVLVGVIFSMLKLPLPAPPVLAGIVGIFGIYLGGLGYHWILERFFN